MNYPETNFVKGFVPGPEARVELKNGRFVDVVNGGYFDPGISVMIQGPKIISLPRSEEGQNRIKADFTIDCQGKTVMPGLFNTHCHITITAPTTLPDRKDVKGFKAYGDRQIEKNMAECLIHGITTIRDAYAEDLRRTRQLRERIAKGEIPGPRFLQSIVVGPPGGYLLEKVGLVMRWMRSALGIPSVIMPFLTAGGLSFRWKPLSSRSGMQWTGPSMNGVPR